MSRSMPVGSGRLEVLVTSQPSEAYGETGPAFFSAQLVDGDKITPITSTRELVRWANSCKADLLSAVAASPAEFAWFVSRMDLHLRPLEIPKLYDYLEKEFQVEVAQQVPRVMDNCCEFLAGHFTLGSLGLWRIKVDITTGDIQRCEVPRRRLDEIS